MKKEQRNEKKRETKRKTLMSICRDKKREEVRRRTSATIFLPFPSLIVDEIAFREQWS